MCKGRYSPKVREDLVPYLYRIGQATGMPMTQVIDLILRPVMQNLEDQGIFRTLESYEQKVKRLFVKQD